MKKMTPEKKVRCIIFAAMTLMVVALIAIVHYFKTLLNLTSLPSLSNKVKSGAFVPTSNIKSTP